ncbi:hypothetical protein CHS0354_036426 [Potamilus streckersoni]|uniref:Uncharacterized protein n=1 Tax=Potamilus streckersoni TaxID=2493646 RepID=A0AAE0SWL9_9BIVA|nr:hypothetical protein CHS0354_036426 [Potamilus streckersoni]
MTGVDYCVIQSSWPCQRDLSVCTKYFLQPSVNSKHDDGSANGEMHVFTLDGTASDPETPCTMQLKCKHQYAVALTGGEIVSESRTIEMYDISGAYLLSCRGQIHQSTEGDEGTKNLYSCRFSLDEPVFALTIKFLSLHGKRECDVSRLMFFVTQSKVRNPSFQPKQSGNINLEKVKGYLHSMGDNIAPDASDLLKSVEQFQQSQMSGLGQLQSVLSRLSSTVSTESAMENQSGGMSALISMMSQLDQSPEASNGQENGKSNKGMIYRMLKDVCGKVTHMRNCKTKSAMETAEPLEQQGTNSSFGPASVPEPTIPLHCNEKSGNGLTIESVRLTFEKMLSEQMNQTEQRLVSYIDEKFSQMEAHLTKKLDELINNTKGNLQCNAEKFTYNSIASQMSTQILDTVISEISRSKQMTTETGKGQNAKENANSDGIELD